MELMSRAGRVPQLSHCPRCRRGHPHTVSRHPPVVGLGAGIAGRWEYELQGETEPGWKSPSAVQLCGRGQVTPAVHTCLVACDMALTTETASRAVLRVWSTGLAPPGRETQGPAAVVLSPSVLNE